MRAHTHAHNVQGTPTPVVPSAQMKRRRRMFPGQSQALCCFPVFVYISAEICAFLEVSPVQKGPFSYNNKHAQAVRPKIAGGKKNKRKNSKYFWVKFGSINWQSWRYNLKKNSKRSVHEEGKGYEIGAGVKIFTYSLFGWW